MFYFLNKDSKDLFRMAKYCYLMHKDALLSICRLNLFGNTNALVILWIWRALSNEKYLAEDICNCEN